MPITSIFIDSELPVIPGMKTLNDFIITNWFKDMPDVDATPFAGYYFGTPAFDITMNSFNNTLPAIVHGSLNNADGTIHVSIDNYLDTIELAPVGITVAGAFIRPSNPTGNAFIIGDYMGEAGASDAKGFAIGINSTGQLRVAAKNLDSTNSASANIAFPSSVPVGALCAFTAYIRQGTITIAVYDPTTSNYVSNAAVLGGTRSAGTNSVLFGRKHDANSVDMVTPLKSVVLMEGAMTESQHVAVMQYLLSME